MKHQQHFFHLVSPSPWPVVAAYGSFLLTTGAVLYFHFYSLGLIICFAGFATIIFSMYVWWRDIITESTFAGCHSIVVQRGLGYGVILFISTEVMFFFAFFWSFFHSSLVPVFNIGCSWPPVGIVLFNPFDVPLLNTLILLTSGASITWAHYVLMNKAKTRSNYYELDSAFVVTLTLACLFTLYQAYEYYNALFCISDGIYGSIFFVLTGFHGFHVIVGTIFIYICYLRFICHHLLTNHHVGFLAAAWYWHFVDVVWLFLYCFVYSWSYFTY